MEHCCFIIFAFWRKEGGYFAGNIFLVCFPGTEIRCLVFVALYAECSIRKQPRFAVFQEFSEFAVLIDFFFVLLENSFQIFPFSGNHFFVINLAFIVQRSFFCQVFFLKFSGDFIVQVFQGNILRMQCIDRYCCIRIRICPGITGSCIIDRKNLDNAKAAHFRPVCQRFEVGKLAYAKTFFGTQGKYRNGNACGMIELPGFIAEEMICFYENNIGVSIGIYPSVVTVFQVENNPCFGIHDAVFVINQLVVGYSNGYFPYSEISLFHRNGFQVFPATEGFHIADQNKSPVGMVQWCFYPEMMGVLFQD